MRKYYVRYLNYGSKNLTDISKTHAAVDSVLTIGIDLADASTYEAGATLLVVLAWPEALDDGDAMGRRHAAICQMYLMARAEGDTEWANEPQLIKPLYLSRPLSEVAAIDRQLRRRLQSRMVAARMIMPFLVEADGSGVTPKWPARSVSVNKMAERVLPDTTESDPSNVKSRVWRASWPVIHLAAAVAVAIQQGEVDEEPISIVNFLADPALIHWVVDVAAGFAQAIPNLRRLHIKAEQLVNLQVVKRGQFPPS